MKELVGRFKNLVKKDQVKISQLAHGNNWKDQLGRYLVHG